MTNTKQRPQIIPAGIGDHHISMMTCDDDYDRELGAKVLWCNYCQVYTDPSNNRIVGLAVDTPDQIIASGRLA